MPFFSKIYDSWKEIQNEKYRKVLDIIRREKINLSEGIVLDIGCGPFFLEQFLEQEGIANDNFICIDVEQQVPKGKRFVLASGEMIPIKSGRVSLIFCLDSIHLIEDVSDFGRVLKPGGLLILSMFCNSQNGIDVADKCVKKLNGFKILKKIIMHGKEDEIIMLCRKNR